jgi:photosystem II stability/assembly factor-like uncharacterized protein
VSAIGCSCLALSLFFPGAARAAESSELAPLASKSLLLDVARAGSRLVAVGDRGHVLLSDDEGRTWRQVIVPTRAMLTAVSFGDAQHGWAVGHDGAVLVTTDAGESWKLQFAGAGVDVIFLDVFFSDAVHGLLAGAYGKCLLTTDGGQTWEPAATVPDEMHINQIAPTATGKLYLAGEAGTLLSSDDAHKPWHKHDVPYEGSLFGVVPLGEHALLTYGLRGHVLVSNDDGATWTERDMPAAVLIMAGLKLKSGIIVLAGAGGNFFLSTDGAKTFTHWKPAGYLGGVSALLETNDGVLLAIGEAGAARVPLQ